MEMERFAIAVSVDRAVCPYRIGREVSNLKGFVSFIDDHRYVPAASAPWVTSPGVRILGAGS